MNKKNIKSVAVLCSGGDSPGMNNAIRSVVRTAIGSGLKAYGIQRGYTGLIENKIKEMDVSSVGNILQRGGTILQTSRSKDFMTIEGRKKAFENLSKNNIDALIIIGGNGSFKGAYKLYEEHNIPIIGIPGTIDNDISGTDYTIGFDTAVQTAVNAVDKIRDTASSHERTFIVEVMGRKSPAIAIHVAVCSGAENIVFPTKEIDFKRIAKDVQRGINRGKNSSILIVAEGEKPGLSYFVQEQLKSSFDLDAHVCVLGHIQRGGDPSHLDRFIGARMGFVAIKALIDNNFPSVTAFKEGQVQAVCFNECLEDKIDYERPYLDLVRVLSI